MTARHKSRRTLSGKTNGFPGGFAQVNKRVVENEIRPGATWREGRRRRGVTDFWANGINDCKTLLDGPHYYYYILLCTINTTRV